MTIKTEDILKISESDLRKYKLHPACRSKDGVPLDDYLQDWNKWVGWNEWRGNKNEFNREYIFSLIDFHHEPDKWLFGGIFKVIERKEKYKIELVELHKELIGRLVIHFHRYKGMRRRAYLLENYYKDFVVSEILKEPFKGKNFPGFENINISFPELENIFKYSKNDWKGALENVKGVYVIVDKSNGKKYVGSAYGDSGIWSRWGEYVGSGHGGNDELIKLISKNGMEYARQNFIISLLEYRLPSTDDGVIRNRESHWKKVLQTNEHGYNKN